MGWLNSCLLPGDKNSWMDPDKISAVGALSVPFTGRGPMSSIDLWKMLYKGKFFYQLYFQEEGVAEEEFEKDLKNAL